MAYREGCGCDKCASVAVHGKAHTYKYGCRCERCRAAWAESCKRGYAKRRALAGKEYRPARERRVRRHVSQDEWRDLANRAWSREEARLARVAALKAEVACGTPGGYERRGCRCDTCVLAHLTRVLG